VNLLVIVGLVFSLIGNAGIAVAKPISGIFNDGESKSNNQPISESSYVPQPKAKPDFKKFNTMASQALIYDTDSGVKLLEKDIDSPKPIASLTKLMTALIIMEDHKPGEIVTVGKLPTLGLEDQKMGLVEGEEIEVGELLKALLIYSANDAANALAIYDSGSLENFSIKMNDKATQWGLTKTKFEDPSGLSPNNTSSANDLLKIASILSVNDTFKNITSTAYTKVSNLSGKQYDITTTNKILGLGGVVGMKTGFTLEAGQCLITAAQRNGRRIITIVLNSPDRFQESKNMVEWSFKNYIWQ
jgi:serine-type D-Ala-D-Ala carboxypeptidase (penicillin-binding protein 5/6)